MADIHPSSLVSPKAELADDVIIGPFCVIESGVKMDSGCRVDSHARIGSTHGLVEMGKNNHIFAGAAIGGEPQDKKYKEEPTKLVLGNDNTVREFATLNIGTINGGGATVIKDANLIMSYAHIGHDVKIGNDNVIASSVNIAGHVEIQNNVIIGGMVGISQFSRLGNFSFIAGCSGVNKDIIPFTLAQGNWSICRATNKIGLERAGLNKEEIANINKAVRILTKGKATKDEAIIQIESECNQDQYVSYLVEFVKSSERGLAV